MAMAFNKITFSFPRYIPKSLVVHGVPYIVPKTLSI